MRELISISVALFIAVMGGQLAKQMHYPRIVGQLLLGLLCSVPIVKTTLSGPQSTEIIKTMSDIGVVLLLFLTGFDINIRKMKSSGREALLISIGAALVPLLSGYALGLLLGLGNIAAFILGICLSITAEGTTVALLLELKKLNSRIGTIILEAGIIDDVLEVFFLAFVLIVAGDGGGHDILLFPLKAIFFAGFAIVVGYVLPLIVHKIERERDMTNLLTLTILTSLLFAMGSELAGFGSVLGAFIGGILMRHSLNDRRDVNGEDHMLQALAFSLFIPFFFVEIGMNFSLKALIENASMTYAILAVAIAGKLLGSMMVKPLVKLSLRQLILIGWGMNSRGIMELVIANIAFKAGIIGADLYSSIVFVAIATTLLFPFAVQHMLKRTPDVMD